MHEAKTPDLLYINDTVVYLMDKSPLERFSNYKNLFASYKQIYMVEVNVEFGAEIPPLRDTPYQVIWSLKDGKLYLSDINFYSIWPSKYKSVFSNNEQYKLMEKLTKVNFDKTKRPLSSNPYRHVNKIGMMPAKWLNDTLLIKRAVKPHEDINKWLISTPCEELVFKNGKLISKKTTNIY